MQRNAGFVPKSAPAFANELLLCMKIAFGLLVLVLIILGLRNRKKEKKEWVKEERYDESGAWIDKRSGERGTYGSHDEEMEANRRYIAKQSKVSELARSVQSFCFAQYPDFQSLSDEKIKRHLAVCKAEASWLFNFAETLTGGKTPHIKEYALKDSPLHQTLKKLILDFSFNRFPKLLDLEIEQIKIFDLAAGQFSDKVLREIETVKA